MATTLCGKHAFMLYYLAPAMKPRFLLTIDENGETIPVTVRVGQAVDTVAQAGQPKGITGAFLSLSKAHGPVIITQPMYRRVYLDHF